jgi:REP element-mobilizing transposase RayT
MGDTRARVVIKSSLPSLWSRSYFVGSAETVTAATIRRYIRL